MPALTLANILYGPTRVGPTGFGSRIDIRALAHQLTALQQDPAINRLNRQETSANTTLSELGKLKSALSSFRDSLTNLTGQRVFEQLSASVDTTGIVSATISSQAVSGAYDIEVISTASAHKLSSQAFTDANTAVGTGSLSISVNGQNATIQIDSSANTLADIRSAINDASDNPGVVATIVTEGTSSAISRARTSRSRSR